MNIENPEKRVSFFSGLLVFYNSECPLLDSFGHLFLVCDNQIDYFLLNGL